MSEPVRTLQYQPDMLDELGYGEMVDAADAAGLDLMTATSARGNQTLRFMLAVAWVIERRSRPITWAEAQRCKLEVGKPATANPPATAGRSPASRSPRATRPTRSER